jgi:uncharacterized protein (DUF1684 family)
MSTHRRLNSMVLVATVLASLAACQGQPAPAESTETYAERIALHREDREERLRSNWLTLAGLYWLEEGDNRFGSAADNAIVFPETTSPALAGNFVYAGGEVFLEPGPDAGLTLDGAAPGDARLKLEPDAQQFGLGRLELFVIERSGRHAIRVRDPEFQAARDFDGIDFYPVDPAYVIEGTLTPPAESKKLMVETVIGSDTEMVSRGTVEFEFAGGTYTLEALGDSEELFLMFKDGTTGPDTYAAGRYLYAAVVGDTVALDFNLAYNPPCAFTPYATCPLPPSGNTIDARIEAGERRYLSGQHK